MTAPVSRRQFVGTIATGIAGASVLGSSASPTIAAIDPIKRTRPSHFKLSIAAYSYRKYLAGDSKSMEMFDFVDLAADLGLDAVEPTSYYFPSDVDASYLNRLKRHAFLLGLDISGTAIGNDFCLPEGSERATQIKLAKTWIERAAILDAPVIRFFAGRVPNGDTEKAAVARAIEGFNEVLPFAEEKGVILALENHGGITATADQMLKLVQGIDHPNFGVNLDSGNFRTADPYGDLARLAPYAVNVQIKTEMTLNGRKQEADLAKLVQILRDVKYSGYIVLEYEAAEEPLNAIPGYVAKLRDLIS